MITKNKTIVAVLLLSFLSTSISATKKPVKLISASKTIEKMHGKSIREYSVIHTGEEETMERYMKMKKSSDPDNIKKSDIENIVFSDKIKEKDIKNLIFSDDIKERNITKLLMPTGSFKDYNTKGWYKQAVTAEPTDNSLKVFKLVNPINNYSKVEAFHTNMVKKFPYLTSLFEKINKKGIDDHPQVFTLTKEYKKKLENEEYEKYKKKLCIRFFNQTFSVFCNNLVKSTKMNGTVKKHIDFVNFWQNTNTLEEITSHKQH